MNRHHIVTDEMLRHYGNLNVALGCIFGAIFAALAIYVVVPLIAPTLAAGAGMRIEAGIGSARYGVAGDNIWYDATYPHQNNLSAIGGVIGVSKDFTKHVGGRAWLVSFGKVSNSAVWPNDPDYFAHDGAPPIYQGVGKGYAYGLALGPTLNFRPAEHWEVTLEGGALLYRARWDESVRSIDPASGAPTGPWVNAASFSKVGVTRSGSTIYDGAMARYRAMFISYRVYRDVQAPDALFGNRLKQVVIGVRKAF